MKLKITHLTEYTYENPVINSVNELKLTPAIDEHQTYSVHQLLVDPAVTLFSYKDYFGNVAHYFTLNPPHQNLSIKMKMIVETHFNKLKETSKLPLEEEYKLLKSEEFQNQYAEYLMETPYTVVTSELITFVNDNILCHEVQTCYQLIEKISHIIYSNFIYDKEATNVHTTLEETLRLRRGVCQDYAHLMIGICRIFNIPARYVSGYQYLGDPDSNQADLFHASHAWVEVYIPLIGWVGFDPTNNGGVDERYVKISYGRDYNDIAPVKGVYQGNGDQKLMVKVDVQFIKDEL